MAEEIEKFDPSKLVDRVRERVQNTFAELIPEEQWKALVQKEINAFLTSHNDGYGHERESGLRQLVHSELRKKLGEILSVEFKSEKWALHWDGQRQQVGKEVERIIIDNAPEILSAMLRQSIQVIVSQMGVNLR